MDLNLLGWDSWFHEAFASFRGADLIPARVAMEDKHAYVLLSERGELSGAVAGRLLHEKGSNADLPKVGDWVAVKVDPSHSTATILNVLPRRSKLARKVPGRELEEQVLAANIDTAFIVQALDRSFNLRRQERFLVMVHEGGAKAVVVLNKADLCPSDDRRVIEANEGAAGTAVILASAVSGQGIELLRQHVPAGKTAVFIGPSGVGKSSLINRLYGEEVQATIEVREKDAKGRHTTTWRELISLPWGGLVIDTPGMREVQMGMAGGRLQEAFPDLEEIAVRCHFRNCSHANEKRCALREAVEAGQVPSERFESYRKLKRELDYLAEERKRHTYLTRRRERAAQRAEDASKKKRWGLAAE